MKKHKAPDLAIVSFQGMVSASPKMFDFFDLVRRVSKTESAVLIRGESGTGKELVARAIHNLSPRSNKNFNGVNCAMLTPELANSELFGHVKGAFTGAVSEHKGYFEQSHRGTLFLDEVAELPLTAQSRLLRIIQEKTFSRMGSTAVQKVDVRILSATHKALRRETMNGTFREDLMYRLRVVPIFLPKLSERGRDIEILLWRFIEEFNRYGNRQIKYVDERALQAMLSYEWPGNIRELRNNVENAFAIGEGDLLSFADLTPELRGELPPGDKEPDDLHLNYGREEKNRIISALNIAAGNKGDAAIALGMSRSTLWRKLKTLGIE